MSHRSSPRVSVIVPAYRVSRYICQAVDSVRRQTFRDWELIVVDDGCPEDSGRLAECFQDPRIRVIRQRNAGLSAARNTGIRAARGSYIALLDADDYWHDEKLSRHVEVLDTEPRVGVVFAGSAMVDECGNALGVSQKVGSRYPGAREIFLKNPIGNGSAPVIRASVFRDAGFTRSQLSAECFRTELRQSEDIDCWLRIALLTRWRFKAIEGAWTYYRINDSGLSANTDAQYAAWQQVVELNRPISPAFFKQYWRAAAALQCRYLARRAVQSGEGGAALELMARALRHDPAGLLADTRKTLSTILGAVLVRLVPEAFLPLFRKAAGAIGG